MRPIKYKLDPNEVHEDAPFRTVCQVLRDAHKLANSRGVLAEPLWTSIKMQRLLEEAYDLAKRMDRKLREYNRDYAQDVFERVE